MDSELEEYKNLGNVFDVSFSKTKEKIWDDLIQDINSKPVVKMNSGRKYLMLAAASVALVLGLTSFARFYKTEITNPAGQHQSLILPCGSEVTLNAGSSFSYYPYWWKISRITKLSGEAFFTVARGNAFSVSSNNGVTKVLGTSFNIYDRNTTYKVFCVTGKVKVTTSAAHKTILLPGQLLDNQDKKSGTRNALYQEVVGWKDKSISFKSEPLRNVLEELERQHNVTIKNKASFNQLINVTIRINNIDTSLTQVCRPFNITFVKISDNNYMLVKN